MFSQEVYERSLNAAGKMLSSSKQRRSILSVVESDGKEKRFSSAQVAVLGILVVGAFLAGSSYRLTHRISSSRDTPEAQLLPSRDGLMSVTRCPERLKVSPMRHTYPLSLMPLTQPSSCAQCASQHHHEG